MGTRQPGTFALWLNSPCGILLNLYIIKLNFSAAFLLTEGKRHDSGMLAASGLYNNLENHSFSPDRNPLCIHDDPAYPVRIHLQAPFRAVSLTPEMEQFNASMSAVRVAVEWLFGDVINISNLWISRKI